MTTESRKSKMARIAAAAEKLATRLSKGERVHLIREYTFGPDHKTDAMGRVLVEAGYERPSEAVGGCLTPLADYLGVESYRLPTSLVEAVEKVSTANDDTKGVQTRRDAIATALKAFAKTVRNARFKKA